MGWGTPQGPTPGCCLAEASGLLCSSVASTVHLLVETQLISAAGYYRSGLKKGAVSSSQARPSSGILSRWDFLGLWSLTCLSFLAL